MEDGSTYQPGWEEQKEREERRRKHDDGVHYHHHNHHHHDDRYSNGWGGAMKQRDKQAYYGLLFIVIAGLAFGAYKVVMMYVNEWRAMPHDDPTTEMKVDELRIRKVDEQDALLHSDSLAHVYQFDSSQIRRVQIDTRAVYRPPRRENEWYITKREWKDIWRTIKRWKQSQRNDEQLDQSRKSNDNSEE